jgi:hypothetical protein
MKTLLHIKRLLYQMITLTLAITAINRNELKKRQ